MPVPFGTVQVYEEMGRLLNEDQAWLNDIGTKITYTMIYDYGAPVNRAFFCRFEAGKVTEVRELEGGEAANADFVITGAADVWRGVLTKKINPTTALTRGQLRVKGKMTTLLRNMGAFSHIIDKMTVIELE